MWEELADELDGLVGVALLDEVYLEELIEEPCVEVGLGDTELLGQRSSHSLLVLDGVEDMP